MEKEGSFLKSLWKKISQLKKNHFRESIFFIIKFKFNFGVSDFISSPLPVYNLWRTFQGLRRDVLIFFYSWSCFFLKICPFSSSHKINEKYLLANDLTVKKEPTLFSNFE